MSHNLQFLTDLIMGLFRSLWISEPCVFCTSIYQLLNPQWLFVGQTVDVSADQSYATLWDEKSRKILQERVTGGHLGANRDDEILRHRKLVTKKPTPLSHPDRSQRKKVAAVFKTKISGATLESMKHKAHSSCSNFFHCSLAGVIQLRISYIYCASLGWCCVVHLACSYLW